MSCHPELRQWPPVSYYTATYCWWVGGWGGGEKTDVHSRTETPEASFRCLCTAVCLTEGR